MKTLSFLVVAILLSSITPMKAQSKGNPLQPQSFSKSFSKKLELEYLLYLPKDYATDKKKSWPLMVFLHGAGERGKDLGVLTKHGPPRLIKEGQEFPFIIVAPQCPVDQCWDDDAVLGLLEAVMKKQRVDPKRVYLTGLSMGGYATWSLVTKYPERFAAAAPICGGGNKIDVLVGGKKKIAALKRVPIWVFHGGKDNVVPLAESERMIETLKKAGVKDIQLTVYPEAQHDSWTATYANPALYEWFLKQSLP
ncbi:MAG TPA: prolyl oligopeptidase family serine peptidase [Roseimicrobium sp.]|nr:prolyl oligopeptidase family serine peptidase [Roseimicrobium sp.]